MQNLFLRLARKIVTSPGPTPGTVVRCLQRIITRAEHDFVLQRAATWNIDVQGRLEWIDGLSEMIETAKADYHENIR